MSEQLTATVVKHGDGTFTIKRGSFIRLRDTPTSKDLRTKMLNRRVFMWGVDVDPETGRVKKDIHLNTKTSLAHFMFGSYQFKGQRLVNTDYKGKVIGVDYVGFGSGVIESEHLEGTRHNTLDLELPKQSSLLNDVKKGDDVLKYQVTELIYFWVSKKGQTYDETKTPINEYGVSNLTVLKARNNLLEKGYMRSEGIDDSLASHKYKNWGMEITNKGEQHYQELVKTLIVEDKQEQYLNLGKQPYEDDLNAESIYDFYQRIIRLPSMGSGEGISILHQHNTQKVLNVVTYYQLGITNCSFEDDVRKILAETNDKEILYRTLKENIAFTKSMCQQLVRTSVNDVENKKNVNVLAQMLGVVEELMA